MNVLEVIHLEKCFSGNLPIAWNNDTSSVDLTQCFALERFEHFRRSAEPLCEGCSVEITIHEDEAGERFAASLWEAQQRYIEINEVAFVGYRDQRAFVDFICPRMILASKAAGRAACFANHRRSSMLARVVVTPKLAIVAPNYEQRHTEIVKGEVVPGIRGVFGATGNDPRSGEDLRLF